MRGQLTPIKYDHRNDKSQQYWLYLCDCGNEKVIRKSHVDSENTLSCGCLNRELAKMQIKINGQNSLVIKPIHGESGRKGTRRTGRTKEYQCWTNIKHRCFNPNAHQFEDYGGRGLTVYGSWINSYETFRDYLLSTIGRCPKGKSLDRIDNNGNYEPGNLRWATRSQQQKNKRPELRTTNPEEIELVLKFRTEQNRNSFL